jgi:hypothetical protein
MPFVSEAQRRWMWANKPDLAREWEAATPPGPLPEHVAPKKRKVTRRKPAAKRKRRR